MQRFLSAFVCFLAFFAPMTLSAQPQAAGEFAGALTALASGKQPLESLQIDARGLGSPHTLTIYGDGVVILDQATQRTLARTQVQELVKELCAANFAGLPDSFGGANMSPGMMRPIRLVGSITVTIGAMTKSVTQIGEGEQSPELAHQIQDVCSGADSPKTASSLADGLDKLRRGELAPETFSLLINRMKGGAATAADPSWLLRVQGRRVEYSEGWRNQYSGGSRKLSPVEFMQLIQLLTASGAASFPNRLYDPHYTDYEFHVLNQGNSGQAREDWLNIGPTTQGNAQKSWEQLLGSLATLYQTGHLP